MKHVSRKALERIYQRSGSIEQYRKITSLTAYKKSEGYLSNEFYHRLRLHGIEAIPEFTDGSNRYDYMVLKHGQPSCIVEVKGSRRAVSLDQIEAYELNSFGVPVFVLAGEELFDHVLTQVLKLVKG